VYVLVFPTTFFRFVQWLTYPFVRDQQAQYVIATMVVGYLSWINLRERIRVARIGSAMHMVE
jgi:hypothetical protein